MNRYSGNSGIVERIPEPVVDTSWRGVVTPRVEVETVERAPVYSAPERAPVYSAPERAPARGGSLLGGLPLGGLSLGSLLGGNKPPEQSLLGGLGDSLGGLLSKFTLESLELEDYLLMGALYLLYRDSGDIEFLLIAGAMLLL